MERTKLTHQEASKKVQEINDNIKRIQEEHRNKFKVKLPLNIYLDWSDGGINTLILETQETDGEDVIISLDYNMVQMLKDVLIQYGDTVFDSIRWVNNLDKFSDL